MIRVPNTVCSFTLTSDRSPVIEMNAAGLDTFDLVVENGDDRPLHFMELRPQVRHRVLIAQLSPGMSYRITTGDASLQPPQYDMAHFATELPVPLDTLVIDELEAMPAPAIEGPAFDPSQWWIWAAIIALMLGMGWMALRMLRKP